MWLMLGGLELNSKHKYAKHYARVFKNIALVGHHRWTEKQDNIFVKALQRHGKDYRKILKHFPSLTYRQIYGHVTHLKN